jgi:hypothetical protein
MRLPLLSVATKCTALTYHALSIYAMAIQLATLKGGGGHVVQEPAK